MSKNKVVDETKKVSKVVLTKKNVMGAGPNSLSVENNQESYDRYFMLGGTIAKMTPATTKIYMKFKQDKNKQVVTE